MYWRNNGLVYRSVKFDCIIAWKNDLYWINELVNLRDRTLAQPIRFFLVSTYVGYTICQVFPVHFSNDFIVHPLIDRWNYRYVNQWRPGEIFIYSFGVNTCHHRLKIWCLSARQSYSSHIVDSQVLFEFEPRAGQAVMEKLILHQCSFICPGPQENWIIVLKDWCFHPLILTTSFSNGGFVWSLPFRRSCVIHVLPKTLKGCTRTSVNIEMTTLVHMSSSTS